jgi:tRNA(Ile)-lysidine synthase
MPPMKTPDPRCLFTEQVRATIEAYSLLPRATKGREPAEPVIVGTSGGPDSVALLRVLHDLAPHRRTPIRRAFLKIAPVVAHLNHGLRPGAADEDQAFVENLARRLELACEVGRADVRREAQALGVGIEEAARHVRRAFLADVARRRGARRIALAHHADDRAETVLFHILRGTGVDGLAALGPRSALLPEEGIEIVRPLIDVPRRLVLGYLAAIGQDYREDETNQADVHTRNRLRNELLPLLAKEFNPKVDDALLRLADQAAAAGEVLADALDEVWRRIVREVPHDEKKVSGAFFAEKGPDTFLPEAIVIDADDFELLRPWMQGAVIRRAVDRLGGGLKYMSMQRTREVVSALLAKTVAGPIDLPGGLVAERRRRTIRIGPRLNA